MSRTSRKAGGRRQQGSGQRSARRAQQPPAPAGGDRTPTTEGRPAERDVGANVLADHPMLATMPHCGSCGGSIRWMLPAELKDIDREAFRKVTAGLAPEVVERSDVWWCPTCGAVGIEDDPYATDVRTDEEDLAAVDLDDRCTDCRTEVEWYDPAHVATIDKDVYMLAKRAFGAADLLGGDAAVCPGCGRITFFPAQDIDG